MTELIQDTLLQSREEAGLVLGQKLQQYEKTNSVVVGIPHSGVSVAASIAKYLSLPLEVMPCQRIKHPADDRKNLGSVSLTEVFLHDNSYCVPQDLIARQVAMLKIANSAEQDFYHENNSQLPLRYKTVIVVDDILKSSEVMLACIHEIKKQSPLRIIVAVPVVGAEAARIIGAEVDDTVFIKMEQEVGHAKEYFIDYSRINKGQVKELLNTANAHSF